MARWQVNSKSKLFQSVSKYLCSTISSLEGKHQKQCLSAEAKHTTKIILKGQKLKLGARQGCLFLSLQINMVPESLVSRKRQMDESTQMGQEVNGLYSQST